MLTRKKLITKFISINTVHYKMLNQNITNVPRKHRKCTKKRKTEKMLDSTRGIEMHAWVYM